MTWIKSSPNWKPQRKKRKSKTPHQKLVDDLDDAVSLYIRLRDGDCVQKGQGRPCKGVLTNGHVFPGRYQSLRWDIRKDGECHAQCWGHNYWHVNHQSDYYEWYINKFGLARFKKLKKEYYTKREYSDLELKEWLQRVKVKYENLKRKKGILWTTPH